MSRNRQYVDYSVGRATRYDENGRARAVNLNLFEDVETGIVTTDISKFEAFIDKVTPRVQPLPEPLDEAGKAAAIQSVRDLTNGGTSGSSGRKRTTGGGAG